FSRDWSSDVCSSDLDLKNYLEQNAVDFISFKANLLAEDSAKDPIKKAETIHEIILSISKIPDLIKREVYVRECSRIMDVSEQVLFNTLAQLLQKSHREGRKKTENVPFEVITPEKEKVEKVDVQKELENEIKRPLVLHGHRKEEFVEWVTSEKSDKAYEVEYQELRVFEKMYLELQDDETHFASPEFRNIFHELINQFVQNPNVQAASFVNDLPPEIAGEVSGILMDEERLYMHDWQRKDIFVKDKNQNIGALVMETLVSLRWHL